MLKYIFIIVCISITCAKAQSDTTANTIMKKENYKTPLEILKESPKDTTNHPNKLPTSEDIYTPEQDSAFYRELNRNIPFSVLVSRGIEFSNDMWLLQKELSSGTPLQMALENIRNIPREFYIPSDVELVHHEIAIQNSQYIPHIRTMPQYGKFNIHEILNFFGLVEDVSPEISYSLDFIANVEVVIYSVSSTVVATLFNGKQSPGKYSITWNRRDTNGKIMPAGDYIGEVRIANDRFIRKRIRIN